MNYGSKEYTRTYRQTSSRSSSQKINQAQLVRVKSQRGDCCPDLASAFNNAVISNPPFETVIHTANSHSYFHDKESRGREALSLFAQAMSDEFKPRPDRLFCYLESNSKDCPYRQKSCDHLLLAGNPRPPKTNRRKILRSKLKSL